MVKLPKTLSEEDYGSKTTHTEKDATQLARAKYRDLAQDY